ncbi:MAG: PhoH family protein [bacterium]
MKERKIILRDGREAFGLFGKHDEYLKLIEENFAVNLVARGDELTISGAEGDSVNRLFEELLAIIREGAALNLQDVRYAIKMIKDNGGDGLHKIFGEGICMTKRGFIKPKTMGQKEYVDAIRQYDLVFGIGPAGTGKTFLSVAMAVSDFRARRVKRIVLTRPAIEAGENLGFLPGDIHEKVAPYLIPLYDALYDILDERAEKLIERGAVEIAPLAYMRGRTLNDAFIILDEAQNTTPEQMKMFLTRFGFNSKVVVNGDITQIDLPKGKQSGLVQVKDILKDIEGIKFVWLTKSDVVRHPLVQEIIQAYENYDGNTRNQ